MTSNDFLQPMGIGELLDKTIKLFKRQFLKFLIITAIGYVPFILLGIIGSVFAITSTSMFSDDINPEAFLDLPPVFWVVWFLLMVLGVIGYGLLRLSLVKACEEAIFEDRVFIGKCFKIGLRKLFPYLVGGFLMFLAVTFGFIRLIIPGIIFLTWFSLFEPVTVLEDSGYTSALGRSRFLVKGYFWRTLGFFIVTTLLSFAIAGILSDILGLIPMVGQIFAVLLQLVVMPFQVIAETLYYYNQRSIKEGFDLTLTPDYFLTPEGDART